LSAVLCLWMHWNPFRRFGQVKISLTCKTAFHILKLYIVDLTVFLLKRVSHLRLGFVNVSVTYSAIDNRKEV
jgi:hypothetical protein